MVISYPSANVVLYSGGRGVFGRGSLSKAIYASKSVIRQLCGKAGHVALCCNKRFDVHFTSSDSQSYANANAKLLQMLHHKPFFC